MTVYVLQMCDWEDQSIISIHSSNEVAEEARDEPQETTGRRCGPRGFPAPRFLRPSIHYHVPPPQYSTSLENIL